MSITSEINADLGHLDQDEEEVVYRVVQESITNAIRHGKATEIRVSISRMEEELHILITDNGIGCSNVIPGFGLHHMNERLEMLGGRLDYTGESGFTVHAVIPVRRGTGSR